MREKCYQIPWDSVFQQLSDLNYRKLAHTYSSSSIEMAEQISLDDPAAMQIVSAAVYQTDAASSPCASRCIRAKCVDNPNCVVNLKRFDGKAANVSIEKRYVLQSVRDIKCVPAGLKNFGATCYLNTLIQIWFYNLSVRRGVYAYKSKNSIVDRVESDIVIQLQRIFASMELSIETFVSPLKFVECMRLDKHMQQVTDLINRRIPKSLLLLNPRFSKLLTNALESLFELQDDPSLHNLMQQQFRGEYEYVMECQSCKTEKCTPCKFYELEIQIDKKLELVNGIQSILSREILDGTNQYMCGVCNVKCDAIRYIRFKKLPEVI